MSDDNDPVVGVLQILSLASLFLSGALIIGEMGKDSPIGERALTLVIGLLLCVASIYSFTALLAANVRTFDDLPARTRVIVAITAVTGGVGAFVGCCALCLNGLAGGV